MTAEEFVNEKLGDKNYTHSPFPMHRQVICEWLDEYALQIAEKAMEEEEQYWEGEMKVHYAFDNLHSRIKSELNSSGVNEDINTTETGVQNEL